jgi:hypothetical protein
MIDMYEVPPEEATTHQASQAESDAAYGKEWRDVPRDIIGDAAAHLVFFGSLFGLINDRRHDRMTAAIARFVVAGRREQ